MKKKLSKRLFVPAIVGALTLCIALGGTYAWYTGGTPGATGEFESGKIALELKADSISYWQREFVDSGEAYTKQSLLDSWLEGTFGAYPDGYSSDMQQELNNSVTNGFATITDFDDALSNYVPLEKVAPGRMIYQVAEYTNTSTIPLYYRVKLNDLTSSKKDAGSNITGGNIFLSLFAVDNRDEYNRELLGSYAGHWPNGDTLGQSTDGYFYCATQVAAGETIKIMLGAYVCGPLNNDVDPLGYTYAFDGVKVDVIQATDNAWRAVDGWKECGVIQ